VYAAASSAVLDVATGTRRAMRSDAQQPDDISSHRVRSNRWPAPLTPHPQTVAEINQAMSEVIEDRS
jgi:hypothetical protein